LSTALSFASLILWEIDTVTRVESDESLIRGGLDGLEQVTTSRVVDTVTGEVNLTLEGLMSATLTLKAVHGVQFISAVSVA